MHDLSISENTFHLLSVEGFRLNSLTVKGTVFGGEGAGARFIGIPWVRNQIRKKLHFDPYLGTLNLRLADEEAESLRERLRSAKGVEIIPEKGFYRALCFQMLISDKIDGCVVIPEKPNYPLDVLEIVASTCLRRELSLNDGDKVEVTLFLEPRV